MKRAKLPFLRLLALAFLLPGLAGLVISALVSTSYLNRLPRTPAADQLRVVPRNIHGTVVYQTRKEERRLSILEDTSLGIFSIGLVMGLSYLALWGNVRSSEWELDDEDLSPARPK
jgi:hypothetical protein